MRLEIYEEDKEDLKITAINVLKNSFQNKIGEYRYEWNQDCSEVSIYTRNINNISNLSEAFTAVTMMLSSI